MTVITLLTDFGTRDGYAGVMKGVIWKIAPDVQIADITHHVKAQNVQQAAIILARTVPFFPAGTIHVAVIDPGVGTNRRPIGLQLGSQYFIGPDNGLFTLVLERAEVNQDQIKVVHLDQKQFWLPEISRVFHGRDIFAPSAAHLARGIKLEQIGTVINDAIRLIIPHTENLPGGGVRGQVIEVDNFGNLSTNIDQSQILGMGEFCVSIAGRRIDQIVNTFGDRPVGTLVSLFGTSHDLIISIVNGNAAEYLQVDVGEAVEVIPVSMDATS
jgi:S-adenosylmethionine hydrolase